MHFVTAVFALSILMALFWTNILLNKLHHNRTMMKTNRTSWKRKLFLFKLEQKYGNLFDTDKLKQIQTNTAEQTDESLQAIYNDCVSATKNTATDQNADNSDQNAIQDNSWNDKATITP